MYSKALNKCAPISKRDQTLTDFVKGKSVAIVGPAPCDDIDRGAEINRYDIVVRLNHGLDLAAAQPMVYGSRTDIAYVNQTVKRAWRQFVEPKFQEVPFLRIMTQHYADIQYVECCYCGRMVEPGAFMTAIRAGPESETFLYAHEACGNISLWWSLALDLNFNDVLKIEQFAFSEFLRDNYSPSATHKDLELLIGVYAMLDLLRREPSSLKLFGFTFYQGLKKEADLDAVYAEGYKMVTKFKGDHVDKDRHQLQLVKKLVNEGFVEVDEVLKKILDEFKPDNKARLKTLLRAKRHTPDKK